MYLGEVQPPQSPSLLDTLNDKLMNRTASVEAITPEGIDPRALNMLVLGPTMILAALATGPISKIVKISLMIGGISTIVSNYAKYKASREQGNG